MSPNSRTMDETVLITGGGQRIGQSIAIDLATHGWRVLIHCNRSKSEADETARIIKEQGGKASVLCADLLVESELSKLLKAMVEDKSPITCLVNNASIFEEDSAMTRTRKTWDKHMEMNLRVPFILSQELARNLPSGKKGNIINMVDQRVWNLTSEFTSYTISKFGLWGLTGVLARAFAPQVRVNAIGPGPTLKSTHQTDLDFKKEWVATPLSEPVSTNDISNAIRFILESPSITGQMIAVDGGQHMGWHTASEK